MNNTKCLVTTCGYFGDIAFATSIAEKLNVEKQFDTVDYLIGFPQMRRLLNNDPFINNVYVSDTPSPYPSTTLIPEHYNKVIKLELLTFEVPPPYEYQVFAGIKNPDTTYKLYTEPSYDEIAKGYIEDLKQNGKKVIALMSNWKPKTYLFTPEEYEAGIDIPNLGYGGRHRNIEKIVFELKNHYNVIEVGVPQEYSQQQTADLPDEDHKSILFECSLMKYCDAFVGAEGGLCNLAAGVGTRTIITGDFIHQLYGWNGVIKKIKDPKLGPEKYFSKKFGHVTLDPYLTDIGVVQQIINNIND
jgi:hypothetical protein